MKNEPRRIIHLPQAIASNASTLSQAQRELGIESYLYYKKKNSFSTTSSKDLKIARQPFYLFHIFFILLRCLFFTDLIMFNFGDSLFPLRKAIFPSDSVVKKITKYIYNYVILPVEWLDVRLLSFFNKKTIMVFQGDDARLNFYSNTNYKYTHSSLLDPAIEFEKDRLKIKHQQILKNNNVKIFSLNPDILRTLPPGSAFLPYSNVNLEDWKFVKKLNQNIKTILHAPSDTGLKGTKYILDAVSKLRSEGLVFKFVLVEGLPREKVKELYSEADLLVDQLLAGWYGGVAVECMALGLPVMCYLRTDDLVFLPQKMKNELPIINVDVETITNELRNFISNPLDITLREKNRLFVEKWHNPRLVARYLQSVASQKITDPIPEFNPRLYQ